MRAEDRYVDGRGFEDDAGYARAARRGAHIFVSGTTADEDAGGGAPAGDTGAQTRVALDRALAAVVALGGTPSDVVRTRLYLAPGADWRAAAAVHGARFGAIRPANTTLFVHALIGDGLLVEVELDAIVEGADGG